MSKVPVDFSDLGGNRVGSAPIDFSDLGGKKVEQAAPLTENGQEVPEGGFSQGHYLKAAIPSGGDLVHAIGLPTSMDEWRQRSDAMANMTPKEHFKAMLQMATPPGVSMITSMAKEAWRAARDPLNPEAGLHALSAMNPIAAPVVDAMSGQGLGTKDANATGLVNSALLTAGEAGPKIAGKVSSIAPDLAAKATAVGKLLPREITGKIPGVGRLDAARTPTFGDYWNALSAKADPQIALFNKTPKLGNTPLSATPIQDALTRPDRIGSGGTTMPRVGTPGNMTQPGTDRPSSFFDHPASAPTLEEQAAKGDWVAQEMLKNKATAAARETMPSAGPSTLPRVPSGESVLNGALTGLDNSTLLKVAKSRGIDVTKEAVLKPGAANDAIIKKIIDHFTPDELDEIRSQGVEGAANKAMQPQGLTPAQGKELWHYKVLGTYFPDVAVPKAMEARARFYMSKRPGSSPAIPPAGVASPQVTAPVNQPIPVTNASNLADILQQSLNLVKKRK